MSSPIACPECGASFAGSRHDARGAGWALYSSRSQWHIDHGPLWCPECFVRLLDSALDAARAYALAHPND